jgi:hypothetical protein
MADQDRRGFQNADEFLFDMLRWCQTSAVIDYQRLFIGPDLGKRVGTLLGARGYG